MPLIDDIKNYVNNNQGLLAVSDAIESMPLNKLEELNNDIKILQDAINQGHKTNLEHVEAKIGKAPSFCTPTKIGVCSAVSLTSGIAAAVIPWSLGAPNVVKIVTTSVRLGTLMAAVSATAVAARTAIQYQDWNQKQRQDQNFVMTEKVLKEQSVRLQCIVEFISAQLKAVRQYQQSDASLDGANGLRHRGQKSTN